MSYKLTTEEENPLWRQYMNEIQTMSQEESKKWEYVIDLPLPFKSTTTSTYSEDEFLEKLKTNEEFNKRWGTLKTQ